MASLYKKRDIWYVSSMIDNKQLSVSLGIKDKRIAKLLKSKVELELLSHLTDTVKPIKNFPFDDLVKRYIEADHNWSKKTKELNEYVFRSYRY